MDQKTDDKLNGIMGLPTTAEIHQMRLAGAKKYIPSAQPYINEAQATLFPAVAAFNWRESYQHTFNMLVHMTDALANIARQKTKAEMDEQEAEDADFEGGYDTIVQLARDAVSITTR